MIDVLGLLSDKNLAYNQLGNTGTPSSLPDNWTADITRTGKTVMRTFFSLVCIKFHMNISGPEDCFDTTERNNVL